METMPSCSSPCRLQLRKGAVAPLTILCLSLLVGVAALVIDGGTLMEARRHVQAAADAAALAGAEDLYAKYLSNQGIDVSGTAKTSALATASANGFNNDGVQSTVTVSTSPQQYQGGPNAGKTIPAGYTEVIIQYNASHLFSGVFGSGTSAVRARAVARGSCTPLKYNGVIVLNLNLSDALTVSGGGLAVNGGIQINSSSSTAVSVTGSGTLTATQITTNPATGSLLGNLLSLLGGSVPSIVTSPPVPDPLRYLPPPNPVQLGLTTQGNNLSISSGIVNLHPGVYNGGIRISGSALVILHANSDGTPGIYYLNGQNGLQISNMAVVTTAVGETAGVMIYNNWSGSGDTINVSGRGSLKIIPPAYGPYRGLSIFQKRGTPTSTGPTVTISGGGNINATGTIYAAHAAVTLSGSSLLNTMGGQIIADSINVSGSAILNINPGSQPIANQRLLGLVE
jgi:Flp pilus assembly protein TadG